MKKTKVSGDTTIKELASLGGKARKEALTKAQRKAIAKKAAEARWADAKKRRGPAV